VLREPHYKVRFREGVTAYERGEYEEALAAFEDSKQANPDFVGAMFGIARTQLKLDQFSLASDEYQQLYERTGEPGYLASVGYCMNMLGRHPDAIGRYSRAVAEGYKTDVVLSNLGFSHLRSRSFAKAQNYLNDALSINSRCMPALYNRALIELQLATSQSSNAKKIPSAAIRDIESAIKSAPGHGTMHFTAARILCLADDYDAAIEHAEKAVDLGFDPASFKHTSTFKPLMKHPRMVALIQQTPAQALLPDPPLVLDPGPAKDFSEFF
jgi:tetratricopeptide (TPR) repeat protein